MRLVRTLVIIAVIGVGLYVGALLIGSSHYVPTPGPDDQLPTLVTP